MAPVHWPHFDRSQKKLRKKKDKRERSTVARERLSKRLGESRDREKARGVRPHLFDVRNPTNGKKEMGGADTSTTIFFHRVHGGRNTRGESGANTAGGQSCRKTGGCVGHPEETKSWGQKARKKA